MSESSEPVPGAPGYEIVSELARSGMGAVYRARDSQLGREVAIKVLFPNVDPKPLLTEARILSQLQHPGIVPIHAFGQFPDGRWFLVMKLIKGASLADILHERESAADEHQRLLPIFERACQTLAYAHARGVIHRDLKPANVVIGAFGEVLVTDWGMAGVTTGGEASAVSGPQNIMGTPAYMPPEQARGEIADTRSDVFGLGGLLCAVLTGEPPFLGKDTMGVIRRSAAGDVAEVFARLDVCGADANLIALAKRCLSPNPADRPTDAGEVARAVEFRADGERMRGAELARVTESNAAERHKRYRAPLLAVVLLFVAVLLLIINAVLLWRS